MDWFQELGVYLQFMPDTPALAFDMTTNGPSYTPFGYSLAYNMQHTQSGLEIYPQEGMAFPGEG